MWGQLAARLFLKSVCERLFANLLVGSNQDIPMTVALYHRKTVDARDQIWTINFCYVKLSLGYLVAIHARRQKLRTAAVKSA